MIIINIKKILVILTTFLVILGVTTSKAFASSEVVYDALPSVYPETSYPSQPFQAQQTFEFGDYVHLGGTNRILDTVTVTMVTWARFSEYATNPTYMNNNVNWTHPITLTVYSNHLDEQGVPDTILAQKEVNITIPWRPEASELCLDGFKWRNSNGDCLNGYAFNAVFNLSDLNVTLPNDVIVSVAYDTQTYGKNPIGVNGPYNSLNVAVPANQTVVVGSDDSVSEVFWNTITAGWYTDGGASGVGIFRKDTNWAPYGTVALKIDATSPVITVTDKNSCKNNGWMIFNNPSFKNQGDCVSFVQSNEKALGNKLK